MPDAEKSLLFVIKANIEDYNKKLGDAERNFKRSFGNIQKELNNTSKMFIIAGAAIVGAFVGATLKFADTADKLVEMSQRTGLSTTALQELGYAAKVSGAELTDLETSIKRMQVSINNGSKAFGELGIKLDDLRRMSPDQQLKTILTALSQIPDAGERSALAIEIFGRSGTNLLPMADNFQQLIDKAHALGLVLSEDTIQKTGDLKDMFDTLGMQFQALLDHLAQTEAIRNLITFFSNLLAKAMEWVDQHPDIVKAFLAVGIAILAVGAAMKAVAIAMAFVNALAGPGGWIKLAAGLAAAAAAVVIINKMSATPTPKAGAALPSAQYGGVISGPGPVGAPVAMIGHVGERFAGPGGGGGGVSIHIHGDFMGDEMSLRALARRVEDVLRQEGNRSVHAPSKTEYYSLGKHL
jgi:hypothetical protein